MGGRRFARRWAAALALAGIALASREAQAAPSARLVYLRDAEASSCPDESAVRAAVAARLGYDPFMAFAPSTMFAEIRREGADYKGFVKLVDPNNVVRGARELVHTGEPCSELVDAMALSMSIAIDPLSLAGPRPKSDEPPIEPPAEEPTPEPKPAPPPPSPARAPQDRVGLVEAREPSPAVHLALGLGPALSLGTAPAPAVGARVGAFVSRGSVGLFVEAHGDLEASRAIARGRVSTRLVEGQLGVCYQYRAFFGCGTASFGALSASAEGITAPRTDVGAHASLGARAGLEVELSPPLYLRVQLDGAAVLTPHTLTVDGEEVSSLSAFAASASSLFAVRFF
jgi:hypothetical protein